MDNVYYSTCAPVQSTTADITFCVDLSCLPNPIAPGVFGVFNGWCANCNFLFDPDGDGIWCTMVTLNEGPNQEYKFFAQDQGEEQLTPGSPCTITNAGFTNRVINSKETNLHWSIEFDMEDESMFPQIKQEIEGIYASGAVGLEQMALARF